MNGNSVRRGMRVQVPGSTVIWYVLDRHPEPGHWWLHRRDDVGEWHTTFEHYRKINQIPTSRAA